MSMRATLFVETALFAFCSSGALAFQYLPLQTVYDPAVPSPASYFKTKIGDRHLRHDQLVGYMRTLADRSDRVTCHQYARSYGHRPLVVLTITAPENQARIQSIRRRHLQWANPSRRGDMAKENLPAVVYMGYTVHGNEASGANAAPLVAYYLAAGRGPQIESLLHHVVVLLDPCLNPDGYARFVHWVNDQRGRIPNPDPNDREHHEPWPGARTNYYWFDLNRDWLPLQHPESRGRIALMRRWLPNLVLDFHEMNTNATFFFQPGVPERTHPLIPKSNVRLTRRMAPLHARALDRHGSLYFTEETFDDFYPGKGSTYPDLHGGVGILFEQASTRGNVQDRASGRLTFPFTIQNQVLASLSSLKAAEALRTDLLDYQRDFYQQSLALAGSGPVDCYLVSAPGDPERCRRFLEILLRHGIQVFELAKDVQADGCSFAKGQSYVVPTEQPEFRFLTALFERRTEFPEPVFYDVSAWTLPLAFDMQCATLCTPLPKESIGRRVSRPLPAAAAPPAGPGQVGYVMDWRGCSAPRALYRLLRAGLRVKVAQKPFAMDVAGERHPFGYGTLLIARGVQDKGQKSQLQRLVRAAAKKDGVSFFPADTGLTAAGIDLGSSAFATLAKPRVVLVTGAGTSAYEAGEVWHLLDQRVGMPVTMVDGLNLAQVSLEDYTAIILASGSYSGVSSTAVEHLKHWLSGGGTLISIGTAARWLNDKKIVTVGIAPSADTPSAAGAAKPGPTPARRPYANARRDAAVEQIRGAILSTYIDITHPVCYGYERDRLPVFRNNRVFLARAAGPYANPVVYAEEPLLSGYVSPRNLARLKGTASVVVQRKGRGRVILMADDPNFRAFWYGSRRLLLNSIFFGPLVR